MAIELDVKTDIREVERLLVGLERKAVPVAASQALNRTIRTVRTHSARQISKETGLKVSEVRPRLELLTAARNRLTAAIDAKPWAPNLIRFGARKVAEGVSANPWRTRKVFKGAFIANSGRTVFARKTKKRLPIKALAGPSIPRTFIKNTVEAIMDRVGRQRWSVEFERAITNQIRRINR